MTARTVDMRVAANNRRTALWLGAIAIALFAFTLLGYLSG